MPLLPRVIDVCPFQGQQALPDKEQRPSNAKRQTLKRQSHQTPQTLRPEQAAGHQTFQKQKPGPLVLEMMFRKP